MCELMEAPVCFGCHKTETDNPETGSTETDNTETGSTETGSTETGSLTVRGWSSKKRNSNVAVLLAFEFFMKRSSDFSV